MKENIALCPMDIGFFGGIRIMLDADGFAQLVQLFFGLWRRWLRHKRLAFEGGIIFKFVLQKSHDNSSTSKPAIMQYI